MNQNIIYGKNPVKEALESNQPITKILVSQNVIRSAYKLVQLARKKGIPVRETDRRKIFELTNHENHQGIVAILSETRYCSIDDILGKAKQKNEPPMIAILDEIQDPQNFGAIIRSVECFGLHGIIIPKDRSVGLTDTVAKTSAGAVAHVPITRVTNLAQTLEILKKEGLWIIGSDETGDRSITDIDFTIPLGIVIGSEGKGMRRLIKEKCDFLVKIPVFGNVNSLNASVAAAIMFWEIRKQRNLKVSG